MINLLTRLKQSGAVIAEISVYKLLLTIINVY